MTMLAINALRYASRLERTGLERPMADEMAHALNDEVADNLVTKRDLTEALHPLYVTLAAIDAKFEAIDARFEAIDARFEAIDARFEAIEAQFKAIDTRFEAIDARFEAMDAKIDALEAKFESRFDAMDKRFESVEARLDGLTTTLKMFMAMTGLGFSLVVTLLVALVARLGVFEDPSATTAAQTGAPVTIQAPYSTPDVAEQSASPAAVPTATSTGP